MDTSGTVCWVRVIETELGPLRIVSDLQGAAELWSWMQGRRGWCLAVDCETNAHDEFDPSFRLRTVQVASRVAPGSRDYEGWVIQHQRPDMSQVLKHVINSHDLWAAWFTRNDLNFLAKGCPGSVRLDQIEPHMIDGQPMLAYYDPRTVTTAAIKDNIDPRIARRRRLKPAHQLHFGTDVLQRCDTAMHDRFKEIAPKDVRGRGKEAIDVYGFEHIDDDDPLYLAYAGLDAICTAQLIDLMWPEIINRGQGDALWADLKLQWHYDLLQHRGLAVDGPYVRWLSDQLKHQVEINSKVLAHYYIGPSGTGPAVGKAFEWLGVESPKKTGTGKPCWDKTVLPEIAEAAPDSYAGILATAIMAVRKAGKYWSSYVKPMLERLEIDGRVHPDLRALGTISSRNSAMRPPLQQLPKKDKRVRAAICAPYPGWVFVTADLQQGEPRTMAARSGDKTLLHDLVHGDLYSAIAKLTYGDRYVEKDGKEPGTGSYILRQKAKFAFLAWTYGCAPKKLASLLSVTASDARKTGAAMFLMSGDEAKAAIKRWERRYPKLVAHRNWLNKQAAVTLESGWVAPLWDRYYVDETGVHMDSSRLSRLGLNYDTQGHQRYLFSTAIHRLIEWGYSWAIYWVMHDEIILCGPKERAAELAYVLKCAMTMDFHGVPIECDVDKPEQWGPTWMAQPQEYMDTLEAATLADLESDMVGTMQDLYNDHVVDAVDDAIARVLVA